MDTPSFGRKFAKFNSRHRDDEILKIDLYSCAFLIIARLFHSVDSFLCSCIGDSLPLSEIFYKEVMVFRVGREDLLGGCKG
jgi:hypothetical protein